VRSITVTGGYSAVATVDLADELGTLNEATIRTALVAEGGVAPVVGSPLWQDPSSEGGAKGRALGHLVDVTVAPGRYNLPIEIVQDGRYEVIWAMDAKRKTRRAVIEVE
jgi:hypothetical protein